MPVATPKIESPLFTLAEGTLERDSAGSRSLLRFAAPSVRHVDGGFTLSNVSALLFDRDGRFVARRSAESSRPLVLATRAAWSHEILNDQLAGAARMVYDIEYRFDFRRKIVGGELPAPAAEADGSDYWRLLNLDPRSLEDRVVRFDFALWARNSSVDITIGQHAKVITDSMRTELELDLLDADLQVAYTKSFSCSLNLCGPDYSDTSLSVDRKTLRTLRFFELRGRTEARAVTRLPIDALP